MGGWGIISSSSFDILILVRRATMMNEGGIDVSYLLQTNLPRPVKTQKSDFECTHTKSLAWPLGTIFGGGKKKKIIIPKRRRRE